MIEDGFANPLMSCSVNPSGRVQTELVACQESIAISHVWSGGLENPTRNGLLECQVRELIRNVHGLQRLTSKYKVIGNYIGSDKDV